MRRRKCLAYLAVEGGVLWKFGHYGYITSKLKSHGLSRATLTPFLRKVIRGEEPIPETAIEGAFAEIRTET